MREFANANIGSSTYYMSPMAAWELDDGTFAIVCYSHREDLRQDLLEGAEDPAPGQSIDVACLVAGYCDRFESLIALERSWNDSTAPLKNCLR